MTSAVLQRLPLNHLLLLWFNNSTERAQVQAQKVHYRCKHILCTMRMDFPLCFEYNKCTERRWLSKWITKLSARSFVLYAAPWMQNPLQTRLKLARLRSLCMSAANAFPEIRSKSALPTTSAKPSKKFFSPNEHILCLNNIFKGGEEDETA
nr:MAG TPA: hypothetical protein [Caudoviricetes sp.]